MKHLITLVKIESMKKVLKSHRAALDFDKDFIMGSISKVGFKFEEEIESNERKRRKGRRKSIHNTYIYIPHQNDLVVRPPSTGGNGGNGGATATASLTFVSSLPTPPINVNVS